MWLNNYQTEEHIDDNDDRWKSFQHQEQIKEKLPGKNNKIEESNMKQNKETENKEKNKTNIFDRYKQLTCCGVIIETQKNIIYIISYIITITLDI